ncbi:MAG: cysteine desulfurase [Bacteroidetes bacterium]|nr:MAG: cysteine desulfurase [Bacteroidota bacterium]
MITVSPHTIQEAGRDETLDRILSDVRKDFPILDQMIHGHPLVYLDNAATSQKPQSVIDRIRLYYEEHNSNVHRGVHSLSQRATEMYEDARETIREFIGAASTTEIVFTRGTTEALNLVAQSYARPKLNSESEILVTMMEHHSNIVPWQILSEQTGAQVKVVPIHDDGTLDLLAFDDLLGERTCIVAITHTSNSLGTINPIEQIVERSHARSVPVVVDGAQAVPHMPVNVSEMGCDFFAFSGHKMFGPTGIGVLYGKETLLDQMPPYQGGGDMIESVSFSGTTFNKLPHKFEAGTPNIAGAIGLGAAVDYIQNLGYEFIQHHESRLLSTAIDKLSEIDSIRFIGQAPQRASVISFLLGDSHPYDVASVLDRLGIAVRTGHHCTQPLMEHFKIPGTVRASFAFYNTLDEIDRLCDALNQASSLLN